MSLVMQKAPVATQIASTFPEGMVGDQGVHINHGWKLHAQLKKEVSVKEAFSRIGLSYDTIPSKDVTKVGVSDEEAFKKFLNKLFDTVKPFSDEQMGGRSASEMSDYVLDIVKKGGTPGGGDIIRGTDHDKLLGRLISPFFNIREDLINPGVKVADFDEVLDTLKVLDENNIKFKWVDGDYGPGKDFSFYAGDIETRDNIISFIEENFGDKLEDAKKFHPEMNDHHQKVNSVTSEKTVGRFTTEYAPSSPDSDYPDLTKSDEGMFKKPLKGAVDGNIDSGTLDVLEDLGNHNPAVREMLHGKPGYESPYATIEGIVEERLGKSGAPVATTVVNPPPQATTSTVPLASQGAAASTPPPAGAPVGKVVPDATTRVSPASTTQNANATAQAQAQASAQRTAPQPAAPQARAVSNTPPAAPSVSLPSSGAPAKGTSNLLRNSRNMSASVASGTKGYGNLKVLGAGILLGVGAQAYSANRKRNSQQEIVYDEY
jgi:hypothetical protein